MKKRIMAVWATMLTACVMVLVSGCTTAQPKTLSGTMPPAIAGDPDEMKADSRIISKTEIIRQAVIRKASISFSVTDVKDVLQKCEKVIRDNSGFIEKSDFWADFQIKMTVKVPSSAFDKVVAELEKCGAVNLKTIELEDVSDRVTDLNAELKSRTALRDRFRELLKEADSIKDAICIEENLSRIQADIDRLQAEMNNLNKRIKYSTINISIDEKPVEKKTVYGPLGYLFVGIVWGIEKLFVISR